MSTPLWKLLRHSGDSEYYWRLIEQSYDEKRLREKMDKIKAEMVDGGVRLTKETVEFEGWDRGGARKSRHASGMTDVRNPRVKKPCAGCGETAMYGREKDKVCSGCAKLILEARTAREKANTQKGTLVKLPRGFPSYSARHERASYYDSHPGIGDAFEKVVRALAPPCSAPHGESVGTLFEGVECNYSGDLVEMGKEGVEAIRALHAKITEAVQEALRKGYEDGQSFLMSLASGEITMKEINDSVVQGRDARRKKK